MTSNETCPVCGGYDIEGGSIDIEGECAFQSMSCDCGATWTDRYVFDDHIDVDPPASEDMTIGELAERLARLEDVVAGLGHDGCRYYRVTAPVSDGAPVVGTSVSWTGADPTFAQSTTPVFGGQK